jgi:uncharacterized protein YndB with AHSA1/START domain
MFSFENQITINRPVGEVFEFLADLKNLPKWNYFLKAVTQTSTGSPGVGATYHQIRRSDQQHLRIREFERDRLLVVETIPPSKPELRRRIDFSPEGEATNLLDSWDLDLGVPKLLEPIAARRTRSGVRDNLEKLKHLLEAGSVTLQDGRKVSIEP